MRRLGGGGCSRMGGSAGCESVPCETKTMVFFVSCNPTRCPCTHNILSVRLLLMPCNCPLFLLSINLWLAHLPCKFFWCKGNVGSALSNVPSFSSTSTRHVIFDSEHAKAYIVDTCRGSVSTESPCRSAASLSCSIFFRLHLACLFRR